MSDQANQIDDIFRKIGDLDAIPDDTDFDSAMLWQRVQTQLAPKPKFGLFWYWAAAICVVLMAGFLAFWKPQINQKALTISKKSINQSSSLSIVSPKKILQKQSLKIKKYSNTLTDSPALSIDNQVTESNSTPQNLPIVSENSVAEVTSPKFEISQQLSLERIVIAPPVVKKKMKIAHINELTDVEVIPEKTNKKDKTINQFIVFGSPTKLGTSQEDYGNIPILTTSGIHKKQ
jgi:hypothetical protein